MQIWWVRRDLRLGDNPALTAALQAGGGVLPAFILDEHLLGRPAERRKAFLLAGLRELEERLKALGSGLVVRAGDPAAELARLAAECGAEAVFAEADVSPYARRRDAAVGQAVALHLVEGLGVYPSGAVRRSASLRHSDGGAYTVFTPYSRAWKSLPFPAQGHAAPGTLPPIPALASVPLPEAAAPDGFPPGEGEAMRRLGAFLDGAVFDYSEERDRMDLEGTSRLSPYLRFGMLSARRAAGAVLEAQGAVRESAARAGCEGWLNELIWREFYQAILYHFPRVLRSAYNPAFQNVDWRNAPEDLAAWQAGRTGYPVVDAGMRQLLETGWMHNRARMITASFLVKDLLIDWQAGADWFLRQLVDGDPAANNGGWQWTAGTGTDAAPYFRIFNPILQGKKFDPDGEYVRRWVPELAGVPSRYIHAPWEINASDLRACGVTLGEQYPAPVVEHAAARARALAAFAESRRSARL